MSRDVIVLLRCDVCPADAPPPEHVKEGIPLGIGRTQVEVDLCPPHEEEARDTLQKFLSAGRKIKRTKTQDDAAVPAANGQELFECPECQKKYRGPQGLGSHRKRAHGINGSSKSVVGKAKPAVAPTRRKAAPAKRKPAKKTTPRKARAKMRRTA